MALSLFPQEAETDPCPSTGGRPRLSATDAGRFRLLDTARLRFAQDLTVEETARRQGVSVATVYRRTAAALDLDGPEFDALRALAAERRGRAS